MEGLIDSELEPDCDDESLTCVDCKEFVNPSTVDRSEGRKGCSLLCVLG